MLQSRRISILIPFRIASEVTFFAGRTKGRIAQQVRLPLGHHVGKLNVPRRRVFPEGVIVCPEILKRGSAIQRQVPNGIFTSPKRSTLIDQSRSRDLG